MVCVKERNIGYEKGSLSCTASRKESWVRSAFSTPGVTKTQSSVRRAGVWRAASSHCGLGNLRLQTAHEAKTVFLTEPRSHGPFHSFTH